MRYPFTTVHSRAAGERFRGRRPAEINYDIGDAVVSVLRTPRCGFVETVLPMLVNQDDGCGVVLDDYHLITNEQIHADLSAFLDVLPAHVTVVVSTRFDPPLRLGRLRVRGQLREIRAADLKFDTSEGSAIFANTNVTSAQRHTLCERTDAGRPDWCSRASRSPDPTAFVERLAGDNRPVLCPTA